jgi:hypothetical protein
MNWNHFILLLCGIYLGYYAVNILADLYLKKKVPGEEPDQDVLFFSDDSQPEIILYEDVPQSQAAATHVGQLDLAIQETSQAYPSPGIESTGAVSLKELISAAQAGLVQYTKAIPY